MPNVRLSFMEIGEVEKSAEVLSKAMLANPLHIALLHGEGEEQRVEIEKMFTNLFNELPGIVYLAKEGQNIVGVMRMKSCMGKKAVDHPKDTADENDIAWRKSVWLAEWARRDPREQHWHLGPIGVLPTHQGQGIGSMLMSQFCKEVDACKATAYLETDLDKNVRFYSKFGFKIVDETDIFGVNNRFMVRAAGA